MAKILDFGALGEVGVLPQKAEHTSGTYIYTRMQNFTTSYTVAENSVLGHKTATADDIPFHTPIYPSILCTAGKKTAFTFSWTRNREVAGSTHTRSTASNLEQVAKILCAQANSASYSQRDGK